MFTVLIIPLHRIYWFDSQMRHRDVSSSKLNWLQIKAKISWSSAILSKLLIYWAQRGRVNAKIRMYPQKWFYQAESFQCKLRTGPDVFRADWNMIISRKFLCKWQPKSNLIMRRRWLPRANSMVFFYAFYDFSAIISTRNLPNVKLLEM